VFGQAVDAGLRWVERTGTTFVRKGLSAGPATITEKLDKVALDGGHDSRQRGGNKGRLLKASFHHRFWEKAAGEFGTTSCLFRWDLVPRDAILTNGITTNYRLRYRPMRARSGLLRAGGAAGVRSTLL